MIAVVFPGQGSQRPGMGRELVERSPVAARAFDAAAAAVGRDLRALLWESDEETLRATENAQIALYAVGVAAWLDWEARNPGATVVAFAGHSVGEYAALAAASVVSVESGARLVAARGRLMAEAGRATPGAMAAVLGLERDALQTALDGVEGTVVIANDNCPGQLVISGEREAVAAGCEAAKAAGAKRAVPLNVSGAFHSPLMAAPARGLAAALNGTAFGPASAGRRVYANVTAEPVADHRRWPGLLEEQLRSPVRWTETVRRMTADGVEEFVECGPGEVLSGLVRRISPGARTSSSA